MPITGATATVADVPAKLPYADSPESAGYGTVLLHHGFSGTTVQRRTPGCAVR